MPDSLTLTAGLPGPGVQIADETDLNLVSARGFTERWSIKRSRISIGMPIQIVANNRAGNQPRGCIINSVVTDIVQLAPQPNEKRNRYRIYFDPAPTIDTGNRDITFLQQPVRYY